MIEQFYNPSTWENETGGTGEKSQATVKLQSQNKTKTQQRKMWKKMFIFLSIVIHNSHHTGRYLNFSQQWRVKQTIQIYQYTWPEKGKTVNRLDVPQEDCAKWKSQCQQNAYSMTSFIKHSWNKRSVRGYRNPGYGRNGYGYKESTHRNLSSVYD